MLKGKGVYLASSNKMQKYRGESHTEGDAQKVINIWSNGVVVGK